MVVIPLRNKETKEDKIAGIKKLIIDIKKYKKDPTPSPSGSNIIDELQKYTPYNLSNIDGIIQKMNTLKNDNKNTFSDKQKESLDKSINHLKYAKGKVYKIIYINIQKYHSASTLLLRQMNLIFQC